MVANKVMVVRDRDALIYQNKAQEPKYNFILGN
jgi:hypothetical protein